MGKFAKVGEARFSEGGIYFLPLDVTSPTKVVKVPADRDYAPCAYLVRVDCVKLTPNRKKVDMFIRETTILESDHPARKPGTSCSQIDLESWDTFLGNVKHFAAVANDIDMDEVDEAGIEMMISEKNPMAGKILRVTAVNTFTTKGEPFTKHFWSQPTAAELAKYSPVVAKTA